MTTASATTGLDVERARRDTPGCSVVAHLNNAGAALPPRVVTDTVVQHLRREAEIGGYEAAAEASEAVEAVYTSIARLLHCEPVEVAVVENATRAWDMAFYAMRFEPGDRILTGRSEYASNVIALLQVARRSGARIEVVDNDEHGQIDLADLERRLGSGTGAAGGTGGTAGRVKLLALTHVPTSGGLVQPAAEVGRLTRAAGVPYLLDACQSAGQLPLDVDEIGCDMLSATGRKFLRGPRGTGFLYVSRRLVEQLEPPLLDLHSARWTSPDTYDVRPDARRFETWEGSYANKLGLGAAVDYALTWDGDEVARRVERLAATLRERLDAMPGVTVHDDGVRRCGIVTFSLAGVDAAAVQRQLSAAGVNTSVTLAEYAQFDLVARGLPDLVRASVHYYNTSEELDQLCEHLPAPQRT